MGIFDLFKENKRFIITQHESFFTGNVINKTGSGFNKYYKIYDKKEDETIDVCQNHRDENSRPLSYDKKYVESFCHILNSVGNYDELECIVKYINRNDWRSARKKKAEK